MKLKGLQLQFNPPTFGMDELLGVLKQYYGLSGELRSLAGERDQNVYLRTPDGRQFVLKISGKMEADGYVSLQAETLAYLAEVAPDLGTPKAVPLRDGSHFGRHRFEQGDQHFFRLVTYLDGTPFSQSGDLSLRSAYEIGLFQGRLCRVLASFFHSAARSSMPWDLSNGLVVDDDLLNYADREILSLLTPHIERLRDISLPALQRQRAQIIHNDLHLGNLLVDGDDGLAGVIDFGDAIFAPLLQDLAVTAAGLVEARPEDPNGVIDHLARGFHEAFPLLPEELELLKDATILRALLCVTLGRYKLELNPASSKQEAIYAASRRGLAALLSSGDAQSLSFDRSDASEGASQTAADDILDRRAKAMSPNYKLFYDEPLHVVRGRGTGLVDASGRAYLDCYNNVPSVGHCHPHVVEALRRQAGVLNTHTRYVHETVVRYAERLTATLPDELDMCLFVCTGTEANDLAYQIARAVTGCRGAVASEFVYHGNSVAVTAVSQYTKLPDQWRDHVRAIPVPDSYRGPYDEDQLDCGPKFAALARDAIDDLRRSPYGLAMLMVDPIFDSPGIFTAPDGYLAELFQCARDAGGLVVVDEVQSGLCRLGDHMWGFQDSGVVPDIVTMGKPMGNGHPLAVVAAKRSIFEAFAASTHYFNTFGGNPVSAAVGNAVLDVIEADNVLQNVHDVGAGLKAGLERMMQRFDAIGDVRGKGLYFGIDLVRDRKSKTPDSAAAHFLINHMRRNGVLVAVTGPHDNVIKIRPPLVFSKDDADLLLEALEAGFETQAKAR